MSKKRRVGLKYCGGCSPRYDRVETVKRIKKELGGAVEFVPPEEPGTDFILAVMGCKTACADLKPFKGRPIRTLTNKDDAGILIKELKGEN